MTKANLIRKLAAELRGMGSMFEKPNDYGLRCRISLTPEQMDAAQKRMDRAAFALDAYADLVAKQESPGPIQTDEERAERKGRGGRPTVTAEMKLAADFLESLITGGQHHGAKENGPERGAV